MKELRDYQVDLSKKAVDILKEKKIVYLQFSVRVGKTATALETCRLYGAKKVLFLTKKKAIGSIESDYKDFGFTFDLTVINNGLPKRAQGKLTLPQISRLIQRSLPLKLAESYSSRPLKRSQRSAECVLKSKKRIV